MKKMNKKWKIPRVFEDFLVRSENLQLWVQIFMFFSFATSFFFICNFIFFHLQLHFFSFSFVFDGFPLCFIVFHGFPGFQVPRARKMKKKWEKKWKIPRVFEDFLVRSENLQLWVQIFIFFSFATSCFFHFPLFLMVFDCFSLFFMAFLDFRCHGQGKWKKNGKKWKKMKISSSFWRFPGSEWESATLSPNFLFFFICNFIFFSFSFVFDGFQLFFMVFLDFRCHGKGKWKKMIKKWSLKWKKNEVWNEKKWCLKWKKMKFGETKNEKKMKNKWKIN